MHHSWKSDINSELIVIEQVTSENHKTASQLQLLGMKITRGVTNFWTMGN